MREILFKAKRADNLEWIYGFLCKEENKYYITEDTEQFYQVISETISQYTGLKDKNGARIFENDILQGFEEYYDEFVKGMIDLDLYNGIQLVVGENSYHLDYIYDYEVIGNAFDKEAK